MTFREKALRIAETHIGVRESPPGSNSGPRVNEYLAAAGLGPGYPWCMAFLVYCFEKAGMKLDYPNRASVGFFEAWARKQGHIVFTPRRGDIVCYRFDGDNWPDHVGIVEKVDGRTVYAIEGNTAYGNDANGGKVMRRSRSLNRCVFVRVPGRVPAPLPTGPVRVDVLVDGKERNTGQRLDNPALAKRIGNLLKRAKYVVIRRSKERAP